MLTSGWCSGKRNRRQQWCSFAAVTQQRIFLCPADNGACGNLRMRWPGALAREAGYDVTIVTADKLPVIVGINKDKNPVAQLIGDIDFDTVVFQRPLGWRTQFAIVLFQRNGVRCVVELDDDLSTVHAQHAAFDFVNPGTNIEANYAHCARAAAAADAVVVTTPNLARLYGRKSIVVENHIPRRYLEAQAEHDPERVVIGWTGKIAGHAGDLNVLGAAMRQVLAAEPSAIFRVVGDNADVAQVLNLDQPPELVEGVGLGEYPGEVARFDIGIAPLGDTAFNRSKSWLKPLDYASCGVPFVCSDTDEYKRFCAQGAGFIARRPRDWIRDLRRLVREPSLRADMAAAGREVAARWVMEDHVDRYVEAWAGESVAAIRENRPMAVTTGEES